jgi:N-hydroxyarylamine O-acetyltransferase
MESLVYLERIGYFEPIKPDVQTLRGLHLAHMRSVPFENLDIGQKRPIRLMQTALWKKIILQKRGGFCYELNGLFAWLLQQIGFDVTYLNARVYNRHGGLGIDFDHLALLVRIPNPAGRWLVDVGFGDSFNEPLSFEEPGEQPQGLRSYKLEKTAGPDGYIVWQKNYDRSWERQYFFDLQPRSFPMDYESRVSLEDGRLILTKDGQRSERPIADQYEYQTLLKQYFGIPL